MAAFVVADDQLVFGADHRVFALVTGDDRFDRLVKILLLHRAAAMFDGVQGRLVDNVGKVGTGSAAGGAGDGVIVKRGGCVYRFGMYPQNGFAARKVGQLYRDAPVKPARAQQRGVQNFGPVGRRQNHDALARVKAVHFGEQLV
ncbi:hypothetical protein SDC9_145991 [bioreactor metagenome]|uniref:Uncharacterized protein n=1 Tax=bioreactor metagenome TaxID=1076179 RepID=A0A645EBU9_9ZZZZ